MPFTIHVAGESLANIQDLDSDGFRELVIGVPSQSLVQICSGANGAAIGTLSTGLPPASRFGTAVANIGDVDGDGYEELLIGAPRAGTAGEAFVFSTLTFAPIRHWAAFKAHPSACPPVTDRYGWSVCKLGDLNGDGAAEIAVGDPQWSIASGTCTSEGLVEVVDVSSALPALRTFITGEHLVATGNAPCTMTVNGAGLGFSVAAIDDLDGDGLSELIVGAAGANLARAYAGASLRPQLRPRATSTIQVAPWQSIGTAMAQSGDFDGDGKPELAVGAPGFLGTGSAHYRFRGSLVGNYHGALIRPIVPFTFNAPAGRLLGWSMASFGDFNGDGVNDYLAGAGSPCNSKTGAHYVVSGATGMMLASAVDPVSFTYGQAVHATGNVSPLGIPTYMVADPYSVLVYVK